MTREDRLYSMKMVDLVKVAEKLGIKINTKAAKSEAVDKILAAEEMNSKNEKELAKEEKLVPMPGAEKLAELKEEYCEDGRKYSDIGKEIAEQAKAKAEACKSSMIDKVVLSKFVKKAQKMITQAAHDSNGYHITVNVNGKEIFYHDKNLQNIRAALGHIYRGEVEV